MSDRGETAAAIALARRNCELTEQIGDVFSRSTALSNLAYAELGGEEYGAALTTIELSDRIYREAMNAGGEGEAWRSTMKARALLGLGRVEEAVEEARWAADTSRSRGMYWQLPTALHTLAQALAANGGEGIEAALEEATEVCERLGHGQALGRIEADREALIGART